MAWLSDGINLQRTYTPKLERLLHGSLVVRALGNETTVNSTSQITTTNNGINHGDCTVTQRPGPSASVEWQRLTHARPCGPMLIMDVYH